MSFKEQSLLFEKLFKISDKFSQKEKEKYNMLLKLHKEDEDLDKLSLDFLNELLIKYQDNSKKESAKKNLENLFKK